MDVDPVAGPSKLARRKAQKDHAIRRRQRNLALDRLSPRDVRNALHRPLSAYEANDKEDTESRFLLGESEAHQARQAARATVARDLASRGQPFLELRPDEDNPFGDVSRILTDIAAGRYAKSKDEPVDVPVVEALPADTGGTADVAGPADAIQIAPIQRAGETLSLPQQMDGFTVHSIGRFGYGFGFIANRTVFPPGYKVTRPFLSITPGSPNVVPHTCEIEERRGRPVFRISSEDSSTIHDAYSITDAWKGVGRPAFQLRGYRCDESIEAALDFFGLSVPRIKRLLEDLVPPEVDLAAYGMQRHQWHETMSIPDDAQYALRTVETTLVKVASSQAIETVIKPAVSPASSLRSASTFPNSLAQSGSRRGSQQSETLSPAVSASRRYSANADELAKSYPASYGSPVPGAGMLVLSSTASPQARRESVVHSTTNGVPTTLASTTASRASSASPQHQIFVAPS